MKNLRPLSNGVWSLLLGLGMLSAAACDSCKEEDSSTNNIPMETSYTCGPGTHQVGNQCVSDR